MTSGTWLEHPDLMQYLREGSIEVEGRLGDASNTTLRCLIPTSAGESMRCVVKPVSGERPLWDFPDWTLTQRELAAYAVSEALGWDLVPPTVWRPDTPGGPGMCQLWIDEDVEQPQVRAVRPGSVPEGFVPILEAEDGRGRPVVLVHADTMDLMRMAVFDAVTNNADRKGGHVLTDGEGRVWAIDHGVTFSVDEKLRTVLWGWAGEAIPDVLMDELRALDTQLAGVFDPVDRWLAEDEREALRERLHALLREGTFPLPSGRWPAVPWPVF